MTLISHDACNALPDRVRSGEGKRIHLIAICGVAMAALAGMLKQRGYQVSGSDENVYPPMSTLLERLGITIREGFLPANVAERPDLVVVGNKVSRDNPEVQAMLSLGLSYLSLPQTLDKLFLEGRRSLVVAGTHGKTTSTALLASILESAGRDPSLMVGGDALDFGGNYKLGNGEDFVIEGDEYDTAFFDKGPKFLHYRPSAVLLTAVEFDHADIYRDLDHVKEAFNGLMEILPPEAPLVVCSDFPHALDVAGSHAAATFGLQPEADWHAAGVRDDGKQTSFEITYRGHVECTAAMQLIGAINARNALGTFVLAKLLGLEQDEILAGIAAFRGVARRQERVGEWNGITLVDDFAHHPTAVAGALAAVRLRYPRQRLWAVFEPRSNTSRRKIFQADYAAAFAAADRVVIASVFQKESDAVNAGDSFSPAQLVADLNAGGTAADNPGDADDIAELLLEEARSGDVILLMSNGGFGGLRAKLARGLEAARQ
jgi:UDP-N-acetylmuramate: L-alanyl-gamma-D-glutamyl-meso-diaminopimelate ligase